MANFNPNIALFEIFDWNRFENLVSGIVRKKDVLELIFGFYSSLLFIGTMIYELMYFLALPLVFIFLGTALRTSCDLATSPDIVTVGTKCAMSSLVK